MHDHFPNDTLNPCSSLRKRHIWFSIHIFCIYCNLHIWNVKDWKKHKGNSAIMKLNHPLFSVHPKSHLSLPLYCTRRVFSTIPDWSFMQNKPQTTTNNYLWILEENRITFYYLQSCYSWSLYFILSRLSVSNIWDSSRCPAFQQRWCHWCQILWQTCLLHKSKELKHQTNYVYERMICTVSLSTLNTDFLSRGKTLTGNCKSKQFLFIYFFFSESLEELLIFQCPLQPWEKLS